jgi:hypothetical protein
MFIDKISGVPGRVLQVAVLFAGCTTDTVSIGEDRQALPAAEGQRCSGGPVLVGDVHVTNQAELDALSGCEEVEGDLEIEVFEGTDLSSLSSLRVVGGTLSIGRRPRSGDGEVAEAIVQAGWLESFHGLESLERVGALVLAEFAAPDLLPLARLRFVNANARNDSQAGGVTVAFTRHLVDLRGLEAVNGIAYLTLQDNEALESLDGISLARDLASVTLDENPRLFDIDALSNVRRVNYGLFIEDTGIVDLSALSSLAVSPATYIQRNPKLADASDLALVSGHITLSDNPALRGVLDLSELSDGGVLVEHCPELEHISFAPGPLLEDELRLRRGARPSADEIVIRNNAKLESVSSALSFVSAGSLIVNGNPSLVSFDFGRFEQLDALEIRDNTNLTRLTLDALLWVDTLDVRDNPRLSTAPLEGLRSFESTMSGNADDAAP